MRYFFFRYNDMSTQNKNVTIFCKIEMSFLSNQTFTTRLIYFFNILHVNRAELAFIQILSYSVLLLKPLISIYFDKPDASKKASIIISSIGTVISFIFFLINLNFLIIFSANGLVVGKSNTVAFSWGLLRQKWIAYVPGPPPKSRR